MYVEYGSSQHIEGFYDPNSDEPERLRFRAMEGERITQVVFPPDYGIDNCFRDTIVQMEHTLHPDVERVDWIESDNPELLKMLLARFGMMPRDNKRRKDYGVETGAHALPSVASLMTLGSIQAFLWLAKTLPSGLVTPTLMVTQALILDRLRSTEVRTLGGRDFFAIQVSGVPGAAANYMPVSTDSTPPTVNDTTLVGEVLTGSLTRAQGTFGHTNGSISYTLVRTYTSDQTISLLKMGVSNSATPGGGTLVMASLLQTPSVMDSGDQTQVTDTVSLGT